MEPPETGAVRAIGGWGDQAPYFPTLASPSLPSPAAPASATGPSNHSRTIAREDSRSARGRGPEAVTWSAFATGTGRRGKDGPAKGTRPGGCRHAVRAVQGDGVPAGAPVAPCITSQGEPRRTSAARRSDGWGGGGGGASEQAERVGERACGVPPQREAAARDTDFSGQAIVDELAKLLGKGAREMRRLILEDCLAHLEGRRCRSGATQVGGEARRRGQPWRVRSTHVDGTLARGVRVVASGALDEDDAKRPNVGGVGVLLALDPLGRHVLEGADIRLGHACTGAAAVGDGEG